MTEIRTDFVNKGWYFQNGFYYVLETCLNDENGTAYRIAPVSHIRSVIPF